MNRNVFLFFSFVFLEIGYKEKQSSYKIGYKEKQSQSYLSSSYKIGYKEKQSQSYLSYLDRFLWRIFLLLRAERHLIFSTSLKIRLLLVRDFLCLLLPRVLGFWFCPTTNFLIFYFRWREEGATSVFRVPANHLASTFFLPMVPVV